MSAWYTHSDLGRVLALTEPKAGKSVQVVVLARGDGSTETVHSDSLAPLSYAALELREQLERGSYEGEDFFRLKVTGNGETKWVNVTAEQLAKIAEVVNGE